MWSKTMENKKQKTVDILKETRKASENGKIRVKEFMGITFIN